MIGIFMLRFILLLIFALLSFNTMAQECAFVKNESICANPKIKILDDSLDGLAIPQFVKLDIEYSISRICKDDVACVHDTLAYQYRTKGNTAKTYVMQNGNTISCLRLRITTPENNNVLIEIDNTKTIGYLSEDMLKTDTLGTYIKESKLNLPANTCKNPEKTFVYLRAGS